MNAARNNEELPLVVKCGNLTAAFYPDKMRKVGTTVGKCIQFKGKWVSPIEFESAAGIQARKWKQSIKLDGKPF